MRSDADGSVSFNGLYLAGLDILLTHTHKAPGVITLIEFFPYAREKRAVNLCKQRALASSLCSFFVPSYQCWQEEYKHSLIH